MRRLTRRGTRLWEALGNTSTMKHGPVHGIKSGVALQDRETPRKFPGEIEFMILCATLQRVERAGRVPGCQARHADEDLRHILLSSKCREARGHQSSISRS